MHKIGLILILIVFVYTVIRCMNSVEKFAESAHTDADLTNSIVTLGQVAKSLQSGGLTVPGTMRINGDLFVGDGSPEWSNNIKVRGGAKEGGYIDFLAKDGTRQSFLMGTPNGVIASHNLQVNGSFNLLPRGVIVAWNGSTAPTGWALCDGQNGTPNLRDRFIVGTGGQYALGATGGSDTVTLNTTQIPSHTHTYWHRGDNCKDVSASGKSGCWMAGEAASVRTSDATGGGQPHENRPPYYALAWIMKL